MKERLPIIGGVLAAFFASVCCIGPLIFAALGVGAGAAGFFGGSARFAASMIPYRPFFVLATIAFLGLGFYSVYRRESVCDGTQCSKDRLRKTKMLLWGTSIVSLILVFSPYLLAIQ
jgi:mercuric ion transport protein